MGACCCAPKEVCLTPGCGKPTFNGKPGEYCSMNCRNSPQAAVNSQPNASNNPGLLLLQLEDGKFDSVKKQYEDKWDKSRGPPTPIRAIYEVQASAAQEKAFRDECTRIGHVNVSGMGTNPGNEQRMFHGTALKCGFQGSLCSNPACSTCSIIQNGFDMTKVGAWSRTKGVYVMASTSRQCHPQQKDMESTRLQDTPFIKAIGMMLLLETQCCWPLSLVGEWKQ